MSVNQSIRTDTNTRDIRTDDYGGVLYCVKSWYWLHVKWNPPPIRYKNRRTLKRVSARLFFVWSVRYRFIFAVLHVLLPNFCSWGMCRLRKASGWQKMQDTADSVQSEAALNYSENLVNYWLVRKVIILVSYEEKFFPVYESGVYREFKAMNFGHLLRSWLSRYWNMFN